MRLLVAAIGRLKSGAERDLAERYRDLAARAGPKIGLRELEIVEIKESRAGDLSRRLLEEAIALANVIPAGAVTMVLDERGKTLDSATFAREIAACRDAGRPALAFVIGGADGLGAEMTQRADLRLAFGAATWPHQLVRIMLLEQIYRAVTILSGHPYHRA